MFFAGYWLQDGFDLENAGMTGGQKIAPEHASCAPVRSETSA
jgi:hypothetical protein